MKLIFQLSKALQQKPKRFISKILVLKLCKNMTAFQKLRV